MSQKDLKNIKRLKFPIYSKRPKNVKNSKMAEEEMEKEKKKGDF